MDEPGKPKEKGEHLAERRYVADERIHEPEKLDAGGVDISGRWGVLIEPRVITSFDHSLKKRILKTPGGSFLNRCYQCGNCTAACPIASDSPAFNPRYFIHVARMGYAGELGKVKDAIFQCRSCGRCSEVCPRDVDPSGAMTAIATVLRS